MGARTNADKPWHKFVGKPCVEPRFRRATDNGQEQKRIKV